MISQEGVEYIVCTLSHKTLFQQPLDLNFATGEELTFFINGKGKFWENPCFIQGKPMLYTGEAHALYRENPYIIQGKGLDEHNL